MARGNCHTQSKHASNDLVEITLKVLVMLLSENWNRPQDERKIPTRTATKSTTKMATNHISLTTVSIPTVRNSALAQLLSTGDTQAAHHCWTMVLL